MLFLPSLKDAADAKAEICAVRKLMAVSENAPYTSDAEEFFDYRLITRFWDEQTGQFTLIEQRKSRLRFRAKAVGHPLSNPLRFGINPHRFQWATHGRHPP